MVKSSTPNISTCSVKATATGIGLIRVKYVCVELSVSCGRVLSNSNSRAGPCGFGLTATSFTAAASTWLVMLLSVMLVNSVRYTLFETWWSLSMYTEPAGVTAMLALVKLKTSSEKMMVPFRGCELIWGGSA